jgi:hypothetical protein
LIVTELDLRNRRRQELNNGPNLPAHQATLGHVFEQSDLRKKLQILHVLS